MSSLHDIVTMLTICLQPVLFLLNLTCNTLSLCALSTRVLRRSSCTHYMLAFTIFAMIYMIQVCPSEFLLAKDICWTCNPYGCKIIKVAMYIPAYAAAIMLLLASIDRYCSTSDSVRLRSMNIVRNAQILIISSTTIVCVYMIPTLFVYNYDESLGIHSIEACIAHGNTLVFIYLISQIVIFYVCIPSLMIIFNYLIIHNIHQSAIRTKGQRMTMKNRRTERQIARMLIVQTGFYGILAFPYAVIYCLTALFPWLITITVLDLRNLFIMWFEMNCFMSFFIYIGAGKVYREQFIQIFQQITRRSQTKVFPFQDGTQQ